MHYGEDKYIGYRGLDTTNCPVAYPFGHGLSYTNFAYPGLDLAICPVTESTGARQTSSNRLQHRRPRRRCCASGLPGFPQHHH